MTMTFPLRVALIGTGHIAAEHVEALRAQGAGVYISAATDVYALGVMTYQLVTGSLPFERPNTGALLLAHLNAPAPDAREHIHGLPRHAAFAIQRAMAKDPDDRFATAGEFIKTLESVV